MVVGSAETGIVCNAAERVFFQNITVNPKTGPTCILKDVKDFELNPQVPVLLFEGVDSALIQGCTAAEGIDVFLELKGESNR